MRLREINSPGELAVDPDLIDRFTQAGWQIDGEGQDQLVMSKPGSNTVLKVVGSGSQPRQAQIRRYVEFFRANQRDPHFPRVGPDRELDWKGRKYYAYTQERLMPLSGDEAVMDYLQYAMAELGHDQEPDFERIPPGLSVEQIEGLIGSVDHMFQAGLGGQYGFDLSNMANIMQRGDGQLVIVDPFSGFDDELQEQITEKINPDTVEPGFEISREMKNGMIIRARALKRFPDMPEHQGIEVLVIDPKYHERLPVADARFKAKQDPETGEWYLASLSTGTLESYRRQGLASAMYNFARTLGNDILPSRLQTQAGRDFWKQGGAGAGRPLEIKPAVDLVAERRTDEVQILAKVKGKGSEPGQIPKYGRPISPDQEVRYLGQQVGKVGRYQLWRDWLGGQLSYHVFDPESRTVVLTTFGSRYHRNPNSYIIHGLYAAPGNPVKAHQFYRNLIQDQGLTLISDRKQSPGGNRVWQRLEAYPDIEVYGFDTKTGEVMNFGAADAEMYAVPPRAAQDRESRYIAKNIRLVATAR